MGIVLKLMNDTFIEILIIAGPFLLASMAVGLVISIFQAVTMIQEQTLVFVPKMLIVILIAFLIGAMLIQHFTDFTIRLFDFAINSLK